MKETFATISLRTDDPDEVAALLGESEAFVSPPLLGWVTVYERLADEGDLARLAELASLLSEALACPALAFLVLAGDVFFYLLFEEGELRDEYASEPEYFGATTPEERAALQGTPERLLPYAVPGVTAATLRAILDDPSLSPAARCQALADRLGILNATLGYHDLAAKLEGAEVPVIGWEDFQLTRAEEEFAEAEPNPPSQNGHCQ
ncbi:MAG: hypothetical protein K6U89_03760 [Chloroflexi bacterium]|nr:hypothetical protein [Chloroflexota bacterium]GIW11293.1 MAG: hypothetical protein KatS3mg061_2350 [Dehalococcoidia bacterium]